jgi:hypothetical protein
LLLASRSLDDVKRFLPPLDPTQAIAEGGSLDNKQVATSPTFTCFLFYFANLKKNPRMMKQPCKK